MNDAYRLIEYVNSDWAVIVDDEDGGRMMYQGHIDDMRERLIELLGIEVEQRTDFRGDREKMQYADAVLPHNRNRFPESATFPRGR